MEIQFQRGLWEGAMVELGHENIKDEDYFRAVVSQNFDMILERSFEIILESIYDKKRDAFKSGVSLKSDVGELVRGRPSGHKISYSFTHRQDDYDNFRSQNLGEGIFAGRGSFSSIVFAVPIPNADGITAFTRARLQHSGEKSWTNRYEAGIKISIGN